MRPSLQWLTICLLGCAGTSVAHAQTQMDSPPTVRLESGVLEGTRFGPAQNEAAFLGIPYAAPPVSDLRWKATQPARKWTGLRQATQFGAACPQRPASWFPDIGWNEDCLYLNVWTPQLSASAKLPVLVYFHGGSNTQGYSQMTPLGPTLAPRGVVVVSANYRLGPFGFLALPALTAESQHHSSGNYGLLDQLQALRWVRENITRFGGNPSRVTVMGQSAGAVDICLLMASPMAAGLFQRAIMESGDCQSAYNEGIRTPIPYNLISSTGEESGELLAEDLGVANGANGLHKLRSIPADDILKAWSQDRRVHFDAIVDGWVVPQQPVKIFAEGRQMHIPVLVGSNADEATLFGHGGPKTVDAYKKYLSEDTGKYSAEEFRAYPVASDDDVPLRYLQLQSDTFAYGAYSMAQAMTRVGQKAYLYYFTYAETGKRAHLGAYHGEELKFLSDSFPTAWEHSRDDEKLGEAIRAYWTKFAKTGNPNAPGLPEWPTYDAGLAQCLELGRTVRVRQVEPQLRTLEQIMRRVFGEAAPPGSERGISLTGNL
jgi:para-nitrobenzyl esterase